MGVYIKGMEMPDKCGSCPCFHAEHPIHCQAVKADKAKRIAAPYGLPRPDWCPLDEVPEPHGRLGDLDELYNHLNEWYLTHEQGFSETEKIYIRGMLLGVKGSPTIIEAEE